MRKGPQVVLHGKRNNSDGLWDISIPLPSTEHLNIIIAKNKSKEDLSRYLHACLFSPRPSTIIRAIRNNHLTTWPGIHDINFNKHLPPSEATSKGHLDQERKNLQSTKPCDPVDHDFFPPKSDTRSHDCCATIIPFSPTNKAFLDLTGRFPHKSSQGNEYIMVVYDYDSTVIVQLSATFDSGQKLRTFRRHALTDSTRKAY